jgi:hypothetical protein
MILLWNHQMKDDSQQVHAVYYVISTVAVSAILDRITTTLAGLVAEIRAGMPNDADVPSPELTTQEVEIVVHGEVTGSSSTTPRRAAGAARSAARPTTAAAPAGSSGPRSAPRSLGSSPSLALPCRSLAADQSYGTWDLTKRSHSTQTSGSHSRTYASD